MNHTISYSIRVSEAIDWAKEMNASTDSRKLIWLYRLQQNSKEWMQAEDYQTLVDACGGEIGKA